MGCQLCCIIKQYSECGIMLCKTKQAYRHHYLPYRHTHTHPHSSSHPHHHYHLTTTYKTNKNQFTKSVQYVESFGFHLTKIWSCLTNTKQSWTDGHHATIMFCILGKPNQPYMDGNKQADVEKKTKNFFFHHVCLSLSFSE